MERIDHRCSAMAAVGGLVSDTIRIGRDAEIGDRIAGADNEEKTEAVREAIDQPCPRRKLTVEGPVPVSK